MKIYGLRPNSVGFTDSKRIQHLIVVLQFSKVGSVKNTKLSKQKQNPSAIIVRKTSCVITVRHTGNPVGQIDAEER